MECELEHGALCSLHVVSQSAQPRGSACLIILMAGGDDGRGWVQSSGRETEKPRTRLELKMQGWIGEKWADNSQ
jgi:hypothetical protein